MSSEELVVWRNARVAVCDDAMTQLEDAAIVSRSGHVAWLGPQVELPDHFRGPSIRTFNLHGAWVTPGLVDCHTHLVFAGNRAVEWQQQLQGVSYEEIARRGGGILSTVQATRRASEAELFDQSAPRLESLLAEGVTTVEIKSGYGLTFESERKMLRVARELGARFPVEIRTTFLAAHALPPEFAGRKDEYVDLVVQHWLPRLHEEGLVDAVDVFCERIAFDAAQARRVLEAGSRLGLSLRMHAEQLSNVGATQLATQFRAASCDHLEYATELDAKAMAAASTVGVLLPTAFLHLCETKRPPVELFRSHGTRMAVASDCNPGSAPSPSLLLAGGLATRLFGLTPREALTGMTRNAGLACGAKSGGELRTGGAADFVIWNVADLAEIVYWLSGLKPRGIVRAGRLIAGTLPNSFVS